MSDRGREVSAVLELDSSAAKGMGSRRGVGRVRHLHCSVLWIQQMVHDGIMKMRKILGTESTADFGTKHVDKQTLTKMMGALNLDTQSGESSLTFKAAV